MNPDAYDLLDAGDRLVLGDHLEDLGRDQEADLARRCPDPSRLDWDEDGRLVAREWTAEELTAASAEDGGSVSTWQTYVAGLNANIIVGEWCHSNDLAEVRRALGLDPEDWAVWFVRCADGMLLVCWAPHVQLEGP